MDTGYWHPDVLRYYGASYQTGEEPYPLTAPEAQFIEPDGIELSDYLTNLCLGGYSVWWQNRKWVCPTLEYCFIPADPDCQLHGLKRENPDLWTHPDPLRAFVESEAERLAPLLRAVQGEILLDLVNHTDRYVLHLLVPFEQVSVCFGACEAWQLFLCSLFSAAPLPQLVFLDTDCEQERGGPPELANGVGKSYGASVYDLSHAPAFASKERDEGELFAEWLQEQECCLKVWGPSEAAAVHNARLVCAEQNLIPVHPITLRYLPKARHLV